MTNNKNKVYESYEKIAQWYDEARSRSLMEKTYLDMATAHLKPGAKVLDLGCGIGEPIGQYLVDLEFQVTGVDASTKMLDIARDRCPKIKCILADMRGLALGERFDCIIAWHSFFHLPQNDQRKMFTTFVNHLHDGGMLLFTSGPDAGEVWSDNGGEALYHASLSPAEYQKLLESHGFEQIFHKIEDEDCGGATVWLAKLHLPALF